MLDVSPRDRRVIAFGVIAMGAIAAIGRGLPAARAWNVALVDSAASLAGELAFARITHRRQPVTHALLATARQRATEIDSSILIATSPSAGAALLSALVAEAGDSSCVKIIATQLHADSVGSASLVRVSVRVTAVGDVSGLLAFLRTIESGDMLMAVEELAISSSDPAAPDDKPEALRAEIVIAALSKVPISKL